MLKGAGHIIKSFCKEGPPYNSFRFSFICSFILVILASKGRAEGTKQLQPAATDNGFIQIFDNNTLTRPFATYNCPVDNRLNIHINTPGEIVYFGLNQPNNDVYFRIKDPLGNIVMGPALVPTSGAGFISTHAQAIAGPSTVNAAGYNPLSFVSTMAGDYYVEFNPVSPTVVTPSKRVFTYFDFTVTSPSNVPATGRLWSKSWDFQCNSGNNPFVADLFIYTNDGVVTGLDFNGIKPFGFVVSSNSSGCTNTGNFVNDRKSQNGNVNYPEYKIFLNDPDIVAYPTGSIGNITSPTTVTGCAPGPYCINVTTDARGSGEVLIDLNGVSGYQAGTKDVLISSTIVPGTNCVSWNGKDGLGNVLAAGTQVPIYVTYLFGLTNLPLYDAEFNPNGYKVYSVRPPAPVPLMRWDDALVGGSTNLTGCAGNTGCHSWPQSGAGFGDVKTINTWWYINTATDNTLLSIPNLTLATSVVGAECDGAIAGSASVTPSNGTAPYTYSWNTSPVQTTASALNLAPGNYTVVVTDGCGTSKTANVAVPVAPVPVVNAGADVKVCPGKESVQLNGSLTGAPRVKWSGGSGVFSPNDSTLNAVYTPSAAEMSSHSVTLTLTSAGSQCAPVTDQMTIAITSPLSASISAPASACYGQKITLNAVATGGTAPYSYLWNTGSTLQTLTNQPGGNYSLTVTDATGNSCQVTANKNVPQNAKLIVSASSNNITSCNTTTSISAVASGGTGGYTYSWNNGATGPSANVSSGTYIVTVSDAVGCTASDTVVVNAVNSTLAATIAQPAVLCNGGTTPINVIASGGFGSYSYLWSTGAATSTINVAAGNYCVRVQDGGGCVVNTCVNVAQDPALIVSLTNPSPVCNGASATLTPVVSGGKAPYAYLWNTGQTTASINKTAGTYSVTVTDANTHGCQKSASATITQTPALSTFLSFVDVSCNGGNDGSAVVNVGGGSAPYNYSWSPGTSNTASATGLSAGSYQARVTDAIGCTTIVNVNITEPAALSATINSSTNVSCKGGANGSAIFSGAGGTPGYTYSWSPSGGTGTTANGLSAGIYVATVEDAKGCRASANITISEPSILSVSVSSTNVSCFGGADGGAAATVAGGTPGYTYLWSASGGTASTVSGRTSGNYSVQVTDAKGCVSSSNFTISQPTKLSAAMTDSAIVSCFGGNDGSATVEASGGTLPYSFYWISSGETVVKASHLSAGTQTVKITDAKACTVTKSVVIGQNPLLEVNISATDSISCDSAIVVNAIANGGDGIYAYLWSDGSTTTTTYVATTGKYEIKVTDGHGCVAKDDVEVIALNSTLAVDLVAPPYICKNATATISTSITPGAAPYNYLWDSGDTTSSIVTGDGAHCVTVTDNQGCKFTNCIRLEEAPELVVQLVNDTVCYGAAGLLDPIVTGGLSPLLYSWSSGETTRSITKSTGTYAITVTDSIACTTSKSADIVEKADMIITFDSEQVKCLDGTNGTSTVRVTGGTAPYSYVWLHDGSTDQTHYNLSAGTYSVTVTDAAGCSKQENVTITQPAQALNILINKTDILCYGQSTGRAEAIVNGGVGPYTYLWWQNGETGSSIDNISAGLYNVIATDALGCEAFDSVRVNQPDGALSSNASKSDVSCFSGNDGKASASVSGGTRPYAYQWSTTATDSSLTGLMAGTYSVIITDNNNCQVKDTVVIDQPAVLVAVKSQTDVLCNGSNTGKAAITVSGGVTPYQYSWSNIVSSDSSVSGLIAGTYVITVTDHNNCLLKDSIIITEPSELRVNLTPTNVLCFGGSSGKLKAVVTGGVSPYSYTWTGGSSTADSLTNLSIGNYKLIVKDANNCQALPVSASLTQPTLLKLSVTDISSVSCAGGNNGTATVKATGGLPGYTYSWSPEGGNGVKGLNLHAGNYVSTVTDTNGCVATASLTVFEPDSLKLVSSVIKNVSCYGGSDGSAMISISGGTAGYITAWSPSGGNGTTASSLASGTYTATVTDAKACTTQASVVIVQPDSLHGDMSGTQVSCNGTGDGIATIAMSGGSQPYSYVWSNGSTNDSISQLSGGNYSVTVTDNKGCQYTRSIKVVEPGVLAINVAAQNVSCYRKQDGSALVSVNGGTGPYTYLWSSSLDTDSLLSPVDTGHYSVTVTDAEGCTDNKSFVILEPSALIQKSTNVSCFGGSNGSATMSVANGVLPYTFLWSNGKNDSTITGLTAGKYLVTATDANGCQLKDSIFVTQPSVLKDSISKTDVSCFGGNNGAASVTVSGGVAPYRYAWDPVTSVDSGINNVFAGTYFVTIQDDHNCILKDSVIIVSPAKLGSVLTVAGISCNGMSDGSIKVVPTGGTAPYTYLWDYQNNVNDSITGLAAGTYNVEVKDAKDCIVASAASITEPQALKTSVIQIKHVSCAGLSDGSALASVTGGTAPFSYNWSPLGGNAALGNGFSAGKYFVAIVDKNGCQTQDSVVITTPDTLKIKMMNISNANCFGAANGAATISISGGTPAYTTLWSNGANKTTISNLIAGSYTVEVTDKNGCMQQAALTITEPNALVAGVSGTPVTCYGAKDGTASVVVSGGTLPYRYLWTNSDTVAKADSLSGGIVIVSITDNNNCSIQKGYNISEPALLLADIEKADISCNGKSDGSALVTAVGGIAPYSFNWTTLTDIDSSVTGLDSGSYTVTIKDARGCAIVKNFIITEPASLQVTLTQKNVTCYNGADGAATALITGGTWPYNYLWSPTGITDSSVTGLQKGFYSVGINDANGCIINSTIEITQPDSILMTVSRDTLICIGQQVLLKAVATGGSGNYIYSWNNGILTGDSINVSPVKSASYIVAVTDSNQCKGAPDTIKVNVNPPLSLKVQADTICVGTSTSIRAIASGGDGKNYTYSWDHNLPGTAGPHTVNPDTSTNYIVKVGDGCGTPSVTDTVKITVIPLPLAVILPYPDKGCVPLTIVFNTENVQGGTGLKYSWNIGGMAVSQSSNPVYIFDSAGVYNISLTVDNSVCSTTASGTTKIEAFPKPDAAFDVASRSVEAIGVPIDYVDHSSTDVKVWMWDFGDGNGEIIRNARHAYEQAGTYTTSLIVRNSYGCMDTAYRTILIRQEFAFYVPNSFTPNGDNNNDTFSGYGIGISKYHMDIFDRWGNHFFATDNIKKPWDGTIAGEMAVNDVYVYLITVWDYKDQRHEYSGHVTLVK